MQFGTTEREGTAGVVREGSNCEDKKRLSGTIVPMPGVFGGANFPTDGCARVNALDKSVLAFKRAPPSGPQWGLAGVEVRGYCCYFGQKIHSS